MDNIDHDTIVRLKCCEFVNDMADRASAVGQFMITEPDALIEAARMIEHYVGNGSTVAFDCDDRSRKFVRGE